MTPMGSRAYVAKDGSANRVHVSTQAPIARVHTKLRVSSPHSPQEREADQIADQVMRMAHPNDNAICPTCTNDTRAPTAVVHRSAQANALSPIGTESAPQLRAAVSLASDGQSLDQSTRAFMEPRFGYDFSRVRIHADEAADRASSALEARAFTAGRDVAF